MEERIQSALGSEEWMTSLLKDIEPLVYRLSYYLTRHPQDAEDVAQETLYKVCTKLSTFRGESSLHTWIYMLVMNTFKDYRRKQKSHGTHTSLTEVASMTTSFEDTSDVNLTVTQLLSELSEIDRQVLILRFYTGLSVKEISMVMKLTQANIKVKLFRLRQRLQRLLTFGGEAL